MINKSNITALKMIRQHFVNSANKEEYDSLYSDTSPGQNVYWCGFGEPPVISFRADFDDKEYNRIRQFDRILIKGRFQGNNLGWIEKLDLELFTGLSRKPLDNPSEIQSQLLELIERQGPMNIQMMKELTGYLVKKITPVLHRLQKAFLIYEDQYNGEWDRGWYTFAEIHPDVDIQRFTRLESLMIILKRFAYRNIFIDVEMVKSFYKLPLKEIKSAIECLVSKNILVQYETGYMLGTDYDLLVENDYNLSKSVFVLHRNDFMVKSNELWLKIKYKSKDNDILQYILIDGEFKGAVMGHFKNGPYIIEDIILYNNDYIYRKEEIIEAVYRVNDREKSPIKLFMGSSLEC